MNFPIISNEAYHGKKDYLNSSTLKTIYSKSDMHLGAFKGNASTNFGTLAHSYILEPESFAKEYSVTPEFEPLSKEMKNKYVVTSVNDSVKEVDKNYGRTKEYREQKEAWEERNPNAVSNSEIEKLIEMQTNIEDGDLYKKFLTGGHAEASVFLDNFLTVLEDGREIRTKAKVRFDYVKEIDGVVYISDLKTCQEASPWSFRSSIYKFGYDIQGAFYLDVASQYFKKPVKFIFLASESEFPHACGWYMLSKETYEKGKHKYSSVIERAVNVMQGGKKRGYESSSKMMEV
jgi:hypothetical protein